MGRLKPRARDRGGRMEKDGKRKERGREGGGRRNGRSSKEGGGGGGPCSPFA